MYQLNVSFTPYLFKQIVFIMKGNYVIVLCGGVKHTST